MSILKKDATNEMFTLFKAAWDTTDYASRVKYPNVGDPNELPKGADPWVRVTIRHTTSSNTTLCGVDGQKTFTRLGLLAFQLFEPPGQGLSGTVDLSKIIADAFEGVTSIGGVIFRGVTINEIGVNGSFYQTNIITSFEYDEIK